MFKLFAVMLVSLVLAGSAFADDFRGNRAAFFAGRQVERFRNDVRDFRRDVFRRDAFRFNRFDRFRSNRLDFFSHRREAFVVRRFRQDYVAPIIVQDFRSFRSYRDPQQIVIRREYRAPQQIQQVIVQEVAPPVERVEVQQEVGHCGCASQIRAVRRVVVPYGY
jgi:hypothetical protein